MNINIKVKIRAYQKGEFPTKVSQLENDEHFISEAPDDGLVYGRQNKEWVDLGSSVGLTTLTPKAPGTNYEGSGLSLELNGLDYTIGVKKYEFLNEEPIEIEDDTVYYVGMLTADNFVCGGTSWSDGGNEFEQVSEYNNIMEGGNSGDSPDVIIYPLDSQGVYNGEFNN